MLWFSTVTGPVVQTRLAAMEGPWLCLTLHIDLGSEPVAGTLAGRPGVAHAFTGWTQLGQVVAAAIDAARERPSEARRTTGADPMREGPGWD